MLKELGSEFAWPGPVEQPLLAWPRPHVLLGLGRSAVLTLLRHVAPAGATLHVPSFFCPSVIDFWRRSGISLFTYSDHPGQAQPDWSTLNAREGEWVLAMNYFGVRDANRWNAWKGSHPGVQVIEDHTHDPLSRWAMHSTADYAFASLRKTFPAPDGALLWSPLGKPLPCEPVCGPCHGSALKLAGMILKREFLAGSCRREPDRTVFRDFETSGESLLQSKGMLPVSPWSRVLLESGYPLSWRTRRLSNVQEFCRRFEQDLPANSRVSLLFSQWPEGHCPLNPVLVFCDEQQRERARAGLIGERVFTPVHWQLGAGAGPVGYGLSKRLLTIPLDHRAGPADVLRVVDVICRKFSGTKHAA
ncbi:MAG: hypothetical protein CMJ81_04505 [Planctomycetaceae bacterium]|nr:hypothetical protein [Planctomycetaceae bacterium]MBP60401.1 hypothetical protein [Planctomycetaceae bacterium]